MLRRTRLVRFIVPNSTSPELPLFLSTKEHHAEPAVGDVVHRVMAYDRRGHGAPTASPAQRYFSGSLLGATATVAGVGLFVLTFAYNIGKPVADAHREYFSKLSLEESAGEEDGKAEEKDSPSPVEEFDDAGVAEEGEDD